MLEVEFELKLGSFSLDMAFEMDREIFVLFGPSGSGKSLTMNSIAGFIEPDKGRVTFDQEVYFDRSKRRNLPPEKRRIGYVLQQSFLFPNMSVRANLIYGLRATEGEYFDEIVRILNLDDLLSRRPRNLSGGEQQRVAIGRALLSRPGILLMDEPVSSLDAEQKWRILAYIKKVHEALEISILYVTHSLDEVEYLADRVGLVDDGRLIEVTTREELAISKNFLKTSRSAPFLNLYPAEVVSQASDTEPAVVRINGKDFKAADGVLRKGERIYVSLPANEIILTRDHPGSLSARNIYCGAVKAVIETNGRSMVVIDAGGFELVAQITTQAARDLNLASGVQVHYLFKTPALQVHRIEN